MVPEFLHPLESYSLTYTTSSGVVQPEVAAHDRNGHGQRQLLPPQQPGRVARTAFSPFREVRSREERAKYSSSILLQFLTSIIHCGPPSLGAPFR